MKLQNLVSKLWKGGKVEKSKQTRVKTSEKVALGTTPLWIGTTVVFALLFFLTAVLDMKVRVTFGQGTTATTGTTAPTFQPTQSAPSGGIADQVGGC